MKEILLYSPIYSFVAESLIQQMNDAEGKDITIRVNSPGGSVFAGWGIVAKSLEVEGNLKIKVDGTADSMASILLLFHKDVEALNVSKFTLHRAATMSTRPSDIDLLAEINKDIRAAFEKKLDIPEFEKIAGVSLDEFFNSENQIDVNINAKQAKQIGLISKINKVEAAEFEALSMKFAALNLNDDDQEPEANNKEEINPKINKMNLEELKIKHPEIYAQAVKVGITAEKDRAQAWMEFVDVDAKAVAEGIESNKPLTSKAMAEFSKKMFSAQKLEDSEKENAEPTGDAAPKTEKEIKAKTEADFLAEVNRELGIDKTAE